MSAVDSSIDLVSNARGITRVSGPGVEWTSVPRGFRHEKNGLLQPLVLVAHWGIEPVPQLLDPLQ